MFISKAHNVSWDRPIRELLWISDNPTATTGSLSCLSDHPKTIMLSDNPTTQRALAVLVILSDNPTTTCQGELIPPFAFTILSCHIIRQLFWISLLTRESLLRCCIHDVGSFDVCRIGLLSDYPTTLSYVKTICPGIDR